MKFALVRSTCFIHLLFLLAAVSVADAQVAIHFDGTGLASATFQGTEYLSSGTFRVNNVTFDDGAGGTYPADLSGWVTVDPASGQVCNNYGWGTVCAVYTASGNRLGIGLSVTNQTGNAIRGVFLEPFAIQLPQAPREYDGVTPLILYDSGEPGVLGLSSPTATVVLGNEDPGKPVIAGFPWALDRPASTIFPFRVNTARDPAYPTSYPTIDRAIPPGGSDQFRFSLRFGGAGATVASLGADLYQNFSATFPQTTHWSDKRPIAQLVLATSTAGYAHNPRGWLLDPFLDVTTPSGRAAFRTRVMAWADQSVEIMRQLNAQGMITWDIEGEEFPHATTYLCDPKVLPQTAPEMDAIADEYFARFRDAGFRVGVCVRPQTLVLNGAGTSQQPSADPGQVLIDKIAYAKARWGASLFYIDSNGDPGLPMDAGVIQRVAAAHPDVLLVPEHENTRYYAYSAPYRELRQQQVSTPPHDRLTYPSAFGVTYVADGDFTRYSAELTTAVSQGDVLMTRGWFPDGANAEVIRIYSAADHPASPLSVSITSPGDGSVVSGQITLAASATAQVGVNALQLQIDGVAYGPPFLSPPYALSLDTSRLVNGPHTISAIAVDGTGRLSFDSVSVRVDNATADTQAPTIVFVSPASGATVLGVVPVQAEASDNSGAAAVEFQVDGANVGTLHSAPYAFPWNTGGAANGVHTITAIARDLAGNQSLTEVSVTVSNPSADVEPPVIALTSPPAGARVAALVRFESQATDNTGVASVQYLVDGARIGPPVLSLPYSFTWDSSATGDGEHTLTALAIDLAGNSTFAGTIAFTVANAVTAPPPDPSQALSCASIPTGVFVGCYYNRMDFQELFSTRIDPVIAFNWDNGAPMAGMRREPYTIRWQGRFAFAGGDYLFRLYLDDGARLYVDDQLVFDAWGEHWAQTYPINLRLSPGDHVIRLEYFQIQGRAAVDLQWSAVDH